MKRVLMFLAALALFVGAYFSFNYGFEQLSTVRQLDRMPVTPASALLAGDYLSEGTILNGGARLTPPYSKEPSVYYRYRLEEEYTDSEGNRKTRTLSSGSSATSFVIGDDSGAVTVDLGSALSRIDVDAPQTYRRKDGDLIYTEYTLQTGNVVQLLARYLPEQNTLSVVQVAEGLPKLITSKTVNQVAGNTLLLAGVLVALAAGLLAVAVALLLSAFGVHRYWVFVVLMTAVLMGALWSMGLSFLQKDWQNAAMFYQQRADAVALESDNVLAQRDLYELYLNLKQAAQGWPDRNLFERFAANQLSLPNLSADTEQQAVARVEARGSAAFDSPLITWLIAIISAFVMILMLVFSLAAIRFKRLVEFVPTSKSTGLSYGIAELFGTVVTNEQRPSLSSKLNNAECVAYQFDISERRGSGKNRRWVSIESGTEQSAFWLQDDHGQVAVYPAGADIRYSKNKVTHEGKRRYSESWLPVNEQVYCLGFAGIDPAQSDKLALQKTNDFRFLITAQNEQQVIAGEGVKGFLFTGVGLGLALLTGLTILAGEGALTPLDLLRVSLIIPIILFILTAIMHYNGLVFLRQRVGKTAADIDTLLQKRHDLWPRLLSTVSAHMAHEKSLLTAITAMRNQSRSMAEPKQAEQSLQQEQQVLGSFIARVEAYPELKANQVVQTFTEQMKRSEDELALIRQGYNDSVELYNNQIQVLPDVLLAKLFAFKPAGFFNR